MNIILIKDSYDFSFIHGIVVTEKDFEVAMMDIEEVIQEVKDTYPDDYDIEHLRAALAENGYIFNDSMIDAVYF